MPLTPIIVIALSGVAILLFQGLPFFVPLAAGAHEKPLPVKVWLVLGVLLLLLGAGAIVTLKPTSEDIQHGLGVFGVMIAGILGKWLWDGLLDTPVVLNTRQLAAALLVSPMVLLGAWKTFSDAPTVHSLLLCFSNGFFWQTIFSDWQRKQAAKGGAGKKG